MKIISLGKFFLVAIFCVNAYGASLLQQQTFPKTVNDLTFIQKVALKQEGYEPWETEYDAEGRCISGCTYPGITIQEEFDMARQHTAQAWSRAQQYLAQQKQLQQASVNTNAQKIASSVKQTSFTRCSPSNTNIDTNQMLPFGLPLIGNPRITSGYGERIHPVTGNLSGHLGIDLAAAIGTDVFSPANGTVSSVWKDATCGNGLKISHTDGYETVYCHLNKVVVKNGDRVYAGCKIAETGNTGRTTGPHLHYAIKENGGYIDPTNWALVRN